MSRSRRTASKPWPGGLLIRSADALAERHLAAPRQERLEGQRASGLTGHARKLDLATVLGSVAVREGPVCSVSPVRFRARIRTARRVLGLPSRRYSTSLPSGHDRELILQSGRLGCGGSGRTDRLLNNLATNARLCYSGLSEP